jgi:hypothetical protein
MLESVQEEMCSKIDIGTLFLHFDDICHRNAIGLVVLQYSWHLHDGVVRAIDEH